MKPILFSTPMVQAVLRGTKTQTRRTVGLNKINENPNEWEAIEINNGDTPDYGWGAIFRNIKTGQTERIKLPYGFVGDDLWVRETFARTTNVNQLSDWPNRPHIVDPEHDESYNGVLQSCVIYKADGPWNWCDDDGFSTDKSHWKPCIFMPKKACRIFLKISNVQVQRLHDISNDDIEAEGVDLSSTPGAHFIMWHRLWESINDAESWNRNPWLWVVKFERINKPENFLG